MSVYLVMYSTEICIGAALLLGLGIGALVAYSAGREKGYGEGFELGFELGKHARFNRDARGRFVKG